MNSHNKPMNNSGKSSLDRDSAIRLLAAIAIGWVLVAALSVILAACAALVTGYWSVVFTVLLFLVIVGAGAVLVVVAAVIAVRLWWNLHRHQFVSDPDDNEDFDRVAVDPDDSDWEETGRE